MTKSQLIIFVKNPELGKVKTRLAASIGEEKALAIYQFLLLHTKYIIEKLENIDISIHFSGSIEDKGIFSNPQFQYEVQGDGDLGFKMKTAFEQSFAKGYHSVCIIGSDCYELSTSIIQEAFKQLKDKKAVIGPAKDGGYYLLGLNQLHSSIFENKKWSSSSVFTDTINDFENLNYNFEVLTELSDIDYISDLPSELKTKFDVRQN